MDRRILGNAAVFVHFGVGGDGQPKDKDRYRLCGYYDGGGSGTDKGTKKTDTFIVHYTDCQPPDIPGCIYEACNRGRILITETINRESGSGGSLGSHQDIH